MPEASLTIQQPIPSEGEKARARELAKHRKCPHCGVPISLADAVAMVQGSGVAQNALVQVEGGSKVTLPTTRINLQTMRIIDPE